jgi:hypothetical protein
MGTMRIRGLFGKHWAPQSSIAAAHSSTGASSRIIAGSNSGTTQCWALVPSTRRSTSVERSRRCGSTFVRGAREGNSFHSHARDDNLSRKYKPSSRCSSLPNQLKTVPIAGHRSFCETAPNSDTFRVNASVQRVEAFPNSHSAPYPGNSPDRSAGCPPAWSRNPAPKCARAAHSAQR